MAYLDTRSVIIEVRVQDLATRGLAGIAGRFARFGSDLSQIGLGISAALTAPIVGALAASVKAFSTLDTALRKVQTITKQSNAEMGKVGQTLIGMSTDITQTTDSAAELGEGLYVLVQRGFSVADSIKILGTASKVATAGLTDTNTAANLIGATMNAYGATLADVGHIGDVFFRTYDRGNITFDELAQNIGDVLPIASMLGLSLEEAMSGVAALTQMGVPTAEAFTWIKRMLMEAATPTDKAAAAAESYGVALGAVTLKSKGMVKFLQDIYDAVGNNISAWDALFPEMRAFMGASTLMSDGGKTVAETFKYMQDSAGGVQTAYEIMVQSFAKQVEHFKNVITEAAQSIGAAFIPILEDAMYILEPFIKQFSKLDDATRRNIVSTAIFLALLGPMLIFTGFLFSGIGAVIAVVQGLGKGFLALAGFATIVGKELRFVAYCVGLFARLIFSRGIGAALGFAGALLQISPVVLAVIGVLALFAAAYAFNFLGIRDKTNYVVGEVIKGLNDMKSVIFGTGETTTEFGATFKRVWADIETFFQPHINDMGEVIAGIPAQLETFKTAASGLWEALKGVGSALRELGNALLTAVAPGLAAANEKLGPLLTTIGGAAGGIGLAILDLALNILTNVAGQILPVATEVVTGATKLLNDVSGILTGAAKVVEGVSTGDWKTAWEGVGEIATNAINGVLDIGDTIYRVVLKLFEALGDAVVETLHDRLGIDVSAEWEKLKTTLENFSLRETGTQIINTLVSGFTSIDWTATGGKLLQDLRRGLQGLKIVEVAEGIFREAQDETGAVNWSKVGAGIAESIKSGVLVSALVETGGQIAEKIKSGITSFDWTKVKQDITDALGSLGNIKIGDKTVSDWLGLADFDPVGDINTLVSNIRTTVESQGGLGEIGKTLAARIIGGMVTFDPVSALYDFSMKLRTGIDNLSVSATGKTLGENILAGLNLIDPSGSAVSFVQGFINAFKSQDMTGPDVPSYTHDVLEKMFSVDDPNSLYSIGVKIRGKIVEGITSTITSIVIGIGEITADINDTAISFSSDLGEKVASAISLPSVSVALEQLIVKTDEATEFLLSIDWFEVGRKIAAAFQKRAMEFTITNLAITAIVGKIALDLTNVKLDTKAMVVAFIASFSTELISQGPEFAISIIKSIGEALSNAGTWQQVAVIIVTELFAGVLSFINSLKEPNENTIGKVSGLSKEKVDESLGLIDQIKAGFMDLVSIELPTIDFSQLLTDLDTFNTDVQGKFDALKIALAAKMTLILFDITVGWNRIKTAALAVLEGLKTDAVAKFESMKTDLEGKITGFRDTFNGIIFTDIFAAIRGFMQTTMDVVDELLRKLGLLNGAQVPSIPGGGSGGGGSSFGEDRTGTGKTPGGGLPSPLRMRDATSGIMKDYSLGMVKGIEMSHGALAMAGEMAGMYLEGGTRDYLQMHSESRLMALAGLDASGGLVAGTVKGLDAGVNETQKATGNWLQDGILTPIDKAIKKTPFMGKTLGGWEDILLPWINDPVGTLSNMSEDMRIALGLPLKGQEFIDPDMAERLRTGQAGLLYPAGKGEGGADAANAAQAAAQAVLAKLKDGLIKLFDTLKTKIRGMLDTGISTSVGLGDLRGGTYGGGPLAAGANGPFEDIYRIQDVAQNLMGGGGIDTQKWYQMFFGGMGKEDAAAAAQQIVKNFQLGLWDESVTPFIDFQKIIDIAKMEEQSKVLLDNYAASLAKEGIKQGVSPEAMKGVMSRLGLMGDSIKPENISPMIGGLLSSIDTSLVDNKDNFRAKGEALWAFIEEGVMKKAETSNLFNEAVDAAVARALENALNKKK